MAQKYVTGGRRVQYLDKIVHVYGEDLRISEVSQSAEYLASI